jgi:hypothetical protein
MKWLSRNWWWLLILTALGVLGVVSYIRYKNEKEDKNKPPSGSSQYTDVDKDQDPLLRKGTSGNKVKELQAKLIAKGYKIVSQGANEPDGLFWNMTETALKSATGATTIQYSKISTIK